MKRNIYLKKNQLKNGAIKFGSVGLGANVEITSVVLLFPS